MLQSGDVNRGTIAAKRLPDVWETQSVRLRGGNVELDRYGLDGLILRAQCGGRDEGRGEVGASGNHGGRRWSCERLNADGDYAHLEANCW